MTIAAVHLTAAITVPLSVLVASGLVWMWIRQGRPDVPLARRRVRRISITLMILSLPALVRGLSFVDHQVQPRDYVVTWTIVLLMLLLIVITAAVDVTVSLRLHRQLVRREMGCAADEAVRAARADRDDCA